MSSNKDLPVSPLAPERFPVMPKVGGMQATTHSLGLYKGRGERCKNCNRDSHLRGRLEQLSKRILL